MAAKSNRASFDRQLEDLQNELLVLGGKVEKAIAKSVEALRTRDIEASKEVVAEDDKIDRARFDIEDECIHLIAQQQPLAGDLRQIVSFLHIATELERMGDYAEGIGRISVMMGDEPPLKPLVDIPRMAEISSDMLHRSLEAMVNRDIKLAEQVCLDDDQVDHLYDQVYRELLTFMIEDPKSIRRATYLLWTAHDLERLADRATNVAERVIFMVTGKMAEINVSKY